MKRGEKYRFHITAVMYAVISEQLSRKDPVSLYTVHA